MKREEVKQLLSVLPILKAYADEEEIEYNPTPNDLESRWVVVTDPSFTYPPNHYRVKPRPQVIYANVYPHVPRGGSYYKYLAEAIRHCGHKGVTKKFAEVMDEEV